LLSKEDFDLSLKISLDKKEMVISNKIGSNLFIKLN
jgi:DtxR family Mn-dependent transcriptional regulator